MRGSSMVIFVPEIISVPAPLGSLAMIRNGLNQVAAAKPSTRSRTKLGTAIRRKRTRRLWRRARRKARGTSERPDAVQPSLRSAVVAVPRRFAPLSKRGISPRIIRRRSGRAKWPRNVAPPGRRASPGCGSGMRENVLRGPAGEIEARPVGQEAEARGGEFGAALAREHRVARVFQRVKMQHVGGRIGDLGLGQLLGAPVGELLLLGKIDAQHLADEVLQAVLVR